MAIKPAGKVILIAIVVGGGIFAVKHYQSAHPKEVKIDSVQAAAPVTVKDTPSVIDHSQLSPATVNTVVKPHLVQTPPVPHKTDKPKAKKKDGSRENVDLENF